ncbi:MAG TPA: hypothetical protein VG015_08740 [Candidatus Dormibacteraeota bacterium]|nr:hypothetical protein [Candidatus Dormibacteraeota bacterium]
MLFDWVIGLVAVGGILAGLLIIAGPHARIAWRAVGEGLRQLVQIIRTPPAANLEMSLGPMHPTTQRALSLAVQLAQGLSQTEEGDLARYFQDAARHLAVDEASGLVRLHTACRRLRRALPGRKLTLSPLHPLIDSLEQTIADRGEQLELLPFR